jgi:hypothetical protein
MCAIIQKIYVRLVFSITRYIISCAMISQDVWNMSVIFGPVIVSMLVEAHVRLVYVPGDDNMKSRVHALKLIKAVFYFACIPMWWLVPVTYNNPIGNEPVWEEYAALRTYGNGIIVCVCCLYAIELVYISIPTLDVKTGAHHVGTVLIAYSLKSDWFVIWEFPVIIYAICFLSGMSISHLVSYVYHFHRQPLMYKWYRGVGIWDILCIIFFHANYSRSLINLLAQDTTMLLSIVRLLLWVVYIVDHANHLQTMYAIHARLKTRCKQQASNDVFAVEQGCVQEITVTFEG